MKIRFWCDVPDQEASIAWAIWMLKSYHLMQASEPEEAMGEQ